MRIDPAEHRGYPWRVHDLTVDFVFDELWEYPIRAVEAKGEDFAAFCAFLETLSRPPPGLAGALFALRIWLGRIFGWDRADRALPIPGCREVTLRDRVRPDERPPEARVKADAMGFSLVYERADERLLELSNATVHAALHLSWVDKHDGTHAPRLAVYWKARGWAGRLYMMLIAPVRVWVVYPALMRTVRQRWDSARAQQAAVAAD